jgi:hypothetical protein
VEPSALRVARVTIDGAGEHLDVGVFRIVACEGRQFVERFGDATAPAAPWGATASAGGTSGT